MSSDQEGDETQIVHRWLEANHKNILRMAYLCTSDPILAEDIAQEAVVKIVKSSSKGETRDKIFAFPAYVHTIVVNCFLDHCRAPLSRSNRREVEFDTTREKRGPSEADLEVRAAIRELPEDERTMIILRYYGGLTIGEAGNQLGVTARQAYRVHDRALLNLEKLLQQGEG